MRNAAGDGALADREKKTKGIALLNKAAESNHPIQPAGRRGATFEHDPEERGAKTDADERDPKGRALDSES